MKITGIVLVIVGILSFCAWSTIRVVSNVQFNRKCGSYLKRAADANTIELARGEVQKAVSYAEKKELVQGYTNILWQTPEEDVGFWYTNIKAALDELNKTDPNTTKLEKTNILMKLRETLLDQGQTTNEITVPPGISIYPYNVLFCFWIWLSVVIAGIGAFLIIRSESY